MNGAFKDFDIDLKFGQEGEQWLKMLASEQTIEVKRERDIWAKTGNIVFEVSCNGVPSGLGATKSSWWAHILTINGEPQSVMLFKTDKLKDALRGMVANKTVTITDGGDGNRAKIILYPLTNLHLLLQ